MREDGFRSWLLNHRGLNSTSVNSRVSNCKTVERAEGDLDQKFESDRLIELIGKLNYSASDERVNRPARHMIPIEGNIRNGSATLKSAISLYQLFCESSAAGNTIIPASPNLASIKIPSPAKSTDGRAWPIWGQPSSAEVLALAHIAIPYVRFLDPEIVRAVVEDTERNRTEWVSALKSKQIDPMCYLWEGSPCAFPGVRRYAGSQEIAAHRGHVELNKTKSTNALALDDNDYPKQIWSFVFRGKKFSKQGPASYALAHLADHKDYRNRFGQDFEVIEADESNRSMFGLYTCISNTVYIPTTLIKPTDFVGTIRALLIRRAQEMYGSICQILPPFLRIPSAPSRDWSVGEFRWAEPVGSTKFIKSFLDFRNDRLAMLLNSSTEQTGL